ncbi:MAG: glutamate-1-semialdehyde 2,1-aminomutase [Lachnospiraceae bacterium]
MTKSEKIFHEGETYIPGGVNSPVRAFGSIQMTPPLIDHANKATLYDIDGNSYIDFIGSWGPMILGHNQEEVKEAVLKAVEKGLSFGAATEMEVRMAQLICEMVPSIEMVRMVNSGTEAVMSAVRTARGYTKRDKIVKFNGCYHGHSDSLLVAAGSGVMTAGIPDSAGVPCGAAQDTITADYNNEEMIKEIFYHNGNEIAAVIIEPLAANMGVVLPEKGFLQLLRNLCSIHGAVLIFDEVITGFRLGKEGAQGYFGVESDLTTFGKIIGAGMPVGAYGGRREIMEMVAPLGAVYQAGTLSGNPIAMTAGHTLLSILNKNPEYYTSLNRKSDQFFGEIQTILHESGIHATLNHLGSIGTLFFTKEKVRDYRTAKTSDTSAYAVYARKMIQGGIYLAPSQFEAMFLSMVHTDQELDQTLSVFKNSIE